MYVCMYVCMYVKVGKKSELLLWMANSMPKHKVPTRV